MKSFLYPLVALTLAAPAAEPADPSAEEVRQMYAFAFMGWWNSNLKQLAQVLQSNQGAITKLMQSQDGKQLLQVLQQQKLEHCVYCVWLSLYIAWASLFSGFPQVLQL